MKRIAMPVLVILFGLEGGTVFGQTLRVPFDFSQSEIAIDATVNGEPLYILLDTGVDPSSIDLQRAEALHLKIDRNAGGQVSGFGECRQQAFCVHGLENDAGLSPPHDDLLWRLPLTIASQGVEHVLDERPEPEEAKLN